MSMLDTLGGVSGGLGGVGGNGSGQQPNITASSAAASVRSDPAIAFGGVGGSANDWGPFSINFPGAYVQGSDSVNAPSIFSIPGAKYIVLALVAAAMFGIAWIVLKKA